MQTSHVIEPKLHPGTFQWSADGFLTVTLFSRAMQAILNDAMEIYARVPRRGAETGGMLLGRKDESGIIIEDFRPVPSEHRFGRLYRLSDNDHDRLREAINAVKSVPGGSEVVGFYRTHARDERG